jgi:hypothetical protein
LKRFADTAAPLRPPPPALEKWKLRSATLVGLESLLGAGFPQRSTLMEESTS